MYAVKSPIAASATFLWIGFICAISFMEAWLKFTAPGITVPLALGIGRIVFRALNYVEWFFAIAILITTLYRKSKILSRQNSPYLIAALLLLLQTVWLLPGLDQRAEDVISARTVAPSYLHIYYVVVELIKVGCLLLFGIKQFKKLRKLNT